MRRFAAAERTDGPHEGRLCELITHADTHIHIYILCTCVSSIPIHASTQKISPRERERRASCKPIILHLPGESVRVCATARPRVKGLYIEDRRHMGLICRRDCLPSNSSSIIIACTLRMCRTRGSSSYSAEIRVFFVVDIGCCWITRQ